MECNPDSFMNIRGSDFGFSNGSSSLSVTDFDISSKFNLPSGSILVSVSNARTSSTGNFIIDDDNPTIFEFSGIVPVLVEADHSSGLLVGALDGITTVNNVVFELVTSLDPGFIAERSENTFTVINESSNGGHSVPFIWESQSFVSQLTFFTTSTTPNNGIGLSIAPVLCPDTDGDGIPLSLIHI